MARTDLTGGITATVDREQRAIIWEQVAFQLDCVGDLTRGSVPVPCGMRSGSPTPEAVAELAAERERVDIGLHLADDLGWFADDPRVEFTITLPTGRLRPAVEGWRETALNELSDHLSQPIGVGGRAPSTDDWRRFDDEMLDTISVCDYLLAQLDQVRKDAR